MKTHNPTAYTPPNDPTAEMAVLGALIVDPSRVDEVASLLLPEDFYDEGRAEVFRAIVRAHAERRPTEAVLRSLTPEQRALATEAVAGAGAPAFASHYATQVRKASQLRGLIAAGLDLAHAAATGKEPATVLDEAERRLVALHGRGNERGLITAGEAALELTERLEALRNGKIPPGLPTGFPKFDRIIGGLHGGELIVIGARPGGGKTSLALQIAGHVARQGVEEGGRVLFASLEMSARELVGRLVSAEARVDGNVIKTGRLRPDESDRVADATNAIARLPIVFADRADQGVGDIRRTARRLASKGLRLVVIDYLGLLVPSDRNVRRHEQLGVMTAELKQLARELNVPILLASQLNRQAADDERPRLSHLRESGSIEQDADQVWLLGSGGSGNGPGAVVLDIAKNRSGPVGAFRIAFDAATTTFSEASGPCGSRDPMPRATPQETFHEFDMFGGRTS